MDTETSQKVCEIIAGLLFADGEFHSEEAKFFSRLLARFGLSSDTKVNRVEDADAAIARLRELEATDRTETLSLLIDAAVADGVVHPAERILIGAVGEELGVSEEVIEARLKLALAKS
jgi:uncharacterized tellurite resistance protein B-like protein